MPRDFEPRPLDPNIDPWERQPDERRYAYFETYRDMPQPRSLRRLARGLDLSLNAVGELSVRWQWQARAHAWDVDQRRRYEAELIRERVAAARRHARIAQGHAQALSLPALEVLRRIQEDQTVLQRLNLEDLLRLQASAARALNRVVVTERLALGVSTENVQMVGADDAPDLASRSDAELDEALELGGFDKAGGGDGPPDDYLAGYADGAGAADPAGDVLAQLDDDGS